VKETYRIRVISFCEKEYITGRADGSDAIQAHLIDEKDPDSRITVLKSYLPKKTSFKPGDILELQF